MLLLALQMLAGFICVWLAYRFIMNSRPPEAKNPSGNRFMEKKKAEKVIYDWNGALNARLMLRKNRQLTLSFSPIISNVVARGTKLTSHQVDRPPSKVVVGLTRPTKSQYRAYQGGFVPRAVKSFVSGRMQR